LYPHRFPETARFGTIGISGSCKERFMRPWYSGARASKRTAAYTGGKQGRTPELWDGRAAERIASHLAGYLCLTSPTR
jgi:hypothetical protein